MICFYPCDRVHPATRTPSRPGQIIGGAALVLALALAFAGHECAAQTNAFTYQGRLSDASGPVNGRYDFTFQLFDAPSGGSQVNLTITNANVAVNNGLFAVALNFGAGAFPGADRWLQIGVKTNGSTEAFSILAPPQPLTPAPYSLYAPNAAIAATAISVTTNSVTGSGIQDLTITSGKIGSGQVVKSINGLFDSVALSAGANVTVTPSGNGLEIAASGATGLNSKLLNVIFEGDSLTQEAGTGTDSPHTPPYSTYPLYLRMLITNNIGSWHNYAVGGNELYNVTNRLSTVLQGINQSASNSIEFLWIGANDFLPYDSNAITDANTWIKTWENYCSNIQSAGIKLVVFTVTDRNLQTDTNYVAFRSNINSRIRSSAFYDYLVDMDARNPDMTTNNWRTFDGTHANTNGAIWQANFVDHCVTPSLGLSAWLGWFSSTNTPSSTSDLDYNSFINRAGITSGTLEGQAVAALVSSAKLHGWWTNCDVIYPFVGGTPNSCAQNLVSSSYPITFSGNVWYTNGIVGDGVTGFGDTGFNPGLGASVYQPTSCHLFCYIGSVDSSNAFVWMGSGADSLFTFTPGAWIGSAAYSGLPDMQARLDCAVGDGAGNLYPGPCIATRTNSAAGGYASHFDNRVDHDAGTMQIYPLSDPVSYYPPNVNMTLLAMNLVGGGQTNFWSGPMLGATIGGGMTPAQWTYFWHDWRAFQMALGRNP
jgi:hypothetical protein